MNNRFMLVVVYGLMVIMRHITADASIKVKTSISKWYEIAENFVNDVEIGE